MFLAVPASHGWQVAVLVSKYVPSEQTPVGESVIVGSTVGKGGTNTFGAAEGCEAMAGALGCCVGSALGCCIGSALGCCWGQLVPMEFAVSICQLETPLERAWTSVGTSSQICGWGWGPGQGRVSVLMGTQHVK